jgi:hypothetical protein
MTSTRRLQQARHLHRLLVKLAVLPLALTVLSGAIYGTVLTFNIDAPWLLRLHTGNFGFVNLQPIYAPLIGFLSLVMIGSGVALLIQRGWRWAPGPGDR